MSTRPDDSGLEFHIEAEAKLELSAPQVALGVAIGLTLAGALALVVSLVI